MYKIIGADGNQYGPVDAARLQQWVRSNRVSGQTLVQAEGATDWRPLSSYPELAAFASSPPPLPLPATYTTRPAGLSTEIPTYLIPAVLCTLLCCLPLGIPAIVFATQVNTKQIKGDIAGAQRASQNARTWCWISFGVGVLWVMLMSILFGSLISGGSPFRLF
jgi:hypothetical protein